MVFGFFFASALLVVIGTYQANAFLDAMANAQGNSITGVFSVMGYLATFVVLNIILIQSLFNMVTLLADQGLGLMGNMGLHADLGKETEGKLHATFMSVGRSAQTIAFSPKEPKPAASAGAKGGPNGAGAAQGVPTRV